MADVVARCLVRETAKGTDDANQRIPRSKKGSDEIERRIGEIEARASYRENQGTSADDSLNRQAVVCKSRCDGMLPVSSLSNSVSSLSSLDRLSSRRTKTFPFYIDAIL